jgi:hypothetical protein
MRGPLDRRGLVARPAFSTQTRLGSTRPVRFPSVAKKRGVPRTLRPLPRDQECGIIGRVQGFLVPPQRLLVSFVKQPTTDSTRHVPAASTRPVHPAQREDAAIGASAQRSSEASRRGRRRRSCPVARSRLGRGVYFTGVSSVPDARKRNCVAHLVQQPPSGRTSAPKQPTVRSAPRSSPRNRYDDFLKIADKQANSAPGRRSLSWSTRNDARTAIREYRRAYSAIVHKTIG